MVPGAGLWQGGDPQEGHTPNIARRRKKTWRALDMRSLSKPLLAHCSESRSCISLALTAIRGKRGFTRQRETLGPGRVSRKVIRPEGSVESWAERGWESVQDRERPPLVGIALEGAAGKAGHGLALPEDVGCGGVCDSTVRAVA